MSHWAEKVRGIRETGLTCREIGELVGLSTSAVNDLAHGRIIEPRGDAAVAIYKLHERIGRRANRRKSE